MALTLVSNRHAFAVVVVGAGGHAGDVAELAHRAGWYVDHFTADQPAHLDLGREVLTPIAIDEERPCLLGIGYPQPRAEVAARYRGWHVAPPVVDPTAVVASSATIAEGSTIFWQASVAPRCVLAAHVLVSYGATVGHDCEVGYCSSVMPGANISGDVLVGDRVLIGAGAVIREGVVVGDDAVVGAGAVVLEDVPAGAMVLGVPARKRS
jgi:sugar O-acyltransferase (sialic acid O-acetyltransferase NeuD family)